MRAPRGLHRLESELQSQRLVQVLEGRQQLVSNAVEQAEVVQCDASQPVPGRCIRSKESETLRRFSPCQAHRSTRVHLNQYAVLKLEP
eukprot:1501071-Rhodomonas_salina.1